jgi:oligopeptidase B
MRTNSLFLLLSCIFITQGCNQKAVILKQSNFPKPPVAEIIPQEFREFSNVRTDNYYWLKDKENPKVLDYLKAENAYTDSVMGSTKELQEKIFNEIKGRIKEEDESYPVLMNGYYYYNRTEKDKQYRIYCRKEGSKDAPEQVVFNINKMAEGKKAMIYAGSEVSRDNRLAAYLSNETGSNAEFTLKIRDLTTGEDLPFYVDGVTSVAWADDNKTLFYTVIDESLRSYRLYRHTLGSTKADEMVYQESDPRFSISVGRSSTNDYLMVGSFSTTTSEYLLLPADTPAGKFEVFLPREQDVEYILMHHKERFYIRYKDKNNLNGMLYEAPLVSYRDRSTWKVILPHDPLTRIESVDVHKDYLAVELRKNGLCEIQVIPVTAGKTQDITFPEPVYTAYLIGNPEYDSPTFRYGYTSLNRPATLFEYNITKGESVKLKEQEIPSGFNPDDYVVERLWAEAPDGIKVPMAVVYKKGLKKSGKNPALLYAYGSYGFSTDPDFDASSYSLIDRGFVYAIAQVRGGSEMGEQWYEDGKLLKKINTFTDFIACAEKLVNDGYTNPKLLAAEGGSAGGLLMGAVANMRPDLFNTIVAEVPFVDVITTMLDSSLPLTTQEYEEWGDPNIEEPYRYMLSYSPYDNIKVQQYPNMLVTGGLNDSQVLFHEPAKWVAKLRATKTDDNILLLYMNMDSGHGGATGRYDSIKETALLWSFILNTVSITK